MLVVKRIWFGDNAVLDSLIQSPNLMSGYNLKSEVRKSSWGLFFHIKEKGIKHIVILMDEEWTDKILHYLPPPFKQEKQDKDSDMREKQGGLEIFIQENVLRNQPPIHSPNVEKLASKVEWPHYVPYRVLQ